MSSTWKLVAVGVVACAIAAGLAVFVVRARRVPASTRVVVTLAAPGLAPEEMEQQIAMVEGDVAVRYPATSLTSSARDGYACLAVELPADAEPMGALQAIRESIKPAALASAMAPPIVSRVDPFTELHVVVSSERATMVEIRRFATQIAEAASRVAGVRGADVCGGASEEVAIEVDATKLAAMGLRIDDVARAVRETRHTSIEDLGVASLPARGGIPIRLSDVAIVARRAARPRCIVTDEGGHGEAVVTVRFAASEEKPEARLALAHAIESAGRELPKTAHVEPIDFDTRERTRVLGLEMMDGGGSRVMSRLRVPGVKRAWLVERIDPSSCAELDAPRALLMVRLDPSASLEAIERALAMEPGIVVRGSRPADPATEANVWVGASSVEEATRVADGAVQALREMPDVRVTTSSPAPPRIDLRLDRKRLADLGVRAEDATTALRAATEGLDVGTLDAIPIVIASGRSDKPEDIARLLVAGSSGSVPLSAVATLERRPGSPPLFRRDRMPAALIHLRAPSASALRDARARLVKNLVLPPGARMTFE